MIDHEDLPVEIQFSLEGVLKKLEKDFESATSEFGKQYVAQILDYAKGFPALGSGVKSREQIDDFKEPIHAILEHLFPSALTHNEIKAVSLPFHNLMFNPTKRFKKILQDAGENFVLSFRNLDEDSAYVLSCVVILNKHYGYDLDFGTPLFYDIPDEHGIMRHYRISMNADFLIYEPRENAVDITQAIAEKLARNVGDTQLWRSYFPRKSWLLRGVTLINLTDVTADEAVSDLKSTLLFSDQLEGIKAHEQFTTIFRSLFNLPDLRVGFTEFDDSDAHFVRMDNNFAKSFILDEETDRNCKKALCENAYRALVVDHQYFSIADVERYAEKMDYNLLAENLLNNNVGSCILAPIAQGEKLLAVLELVSTTKNSLNGVNAKKLDEVIPYLVSTIQQKRYQTQNRIKAVIQSECTSIHPSVLWIFEREAKRYMQLQDAGKFAAFRDISFQDVYPLYGQIDIVGSSEERNQAIKRDMTTQLKLVDDILELAIGIRAMPIYEQLRYRISAFIGALAEGLNASSETEVINLLKEEVNPMLSHIGTDIPELAKSIGNYEAAINEDTGLVYDHRRSYDDAVQSINQAMATFLDLKQQEAQQIYPHYFERYKTDGVDHNMYIGKSMSRSGDFNKIYLYNLRLWQLCTMCEMESQFYNSQQGASLKLDAASLILVYSNTLSIRYRMDEKKFDVDGTYNARYEIIKKRIDKAHVKGGQERITQKGKIAVIYSQDDDAVEYGRYIKYLQAKNYLGTEIEHLELEDVQGVIGLRAMRVKVLYTHNEARSEEAELITYENLMEVLD